ncbi:hypothetical protein [Bacteroides timonensis]|uniref:hypothetical protein n=1 Tax=Bacteroides timonensis TaxID=1470345 RepID=UPI0004B271C2|nr:hypothetical protein [Bacteroides timonensis]
MANSGHPREKLPRICHYYYFDMDGAARLLNAARKRNYPQDTWAEYLCTSPKVQ